MGMTAAARCFAALLALFTAMSTDVLADCKNHFILGSPCDEAQWTPTGEMSLARSYHTATLLRDGKVLVVGGRDTASRWWNGISNSELYDPRSGAWMTTGALNVARVDHQAVLLSDGKLLVVGGDYPHGSPSHAVPFEGTAELYDPDSGMWTRTGRLNTPRQDFSMTLLPTGEVLVAGGYDTSYRELNSSELYDPQSGTWRYTGSLASVRFWHSATLLKDGRVMAVGGFVNEMFMYATAATEIYDPGTERWTDGDALPLARPMHTATLLGNGEVMVLGGQLVDLFRPGKGWDAAPSLAMPREAHTATVRLDGKLVVAGGSHMGKPARTDVYDPASGRWLTGRPLISTRSSHTATLLPSGEILVAGGTSPDGEVLKSSEVYGYPAR